jgi:ribosomal-protein-alanine N-acetyltransferase
MSYVIGGGEGSRVGLRPISRDDEEEFLRLSRASAELHHPWFAWPTTPAAFATYVARFDAPANVGLLVCETRTGAVAGGVNINNIVTGAFRCGALGYAAFAPSAGRGYMSAGLGLAVRYAFGALGLHRLEANIQPGNTASLRLVRRLGFRKEGYSPDFLYIDGAWRDHERWAITSEMVPTEPS